MKKEEYKRLANLVERAKQNDPRIKNAREAEKLRCVFWFFALFLFCVYVCVLVESSFGGGGGH